LIFQINFFGVVELLEAWRPTLIATSVAKVVVVASNSTTTTRFVPRRAVRALLNGDPAKAEHTMRRRPPAAALAYAASKLAVARWVRRHAVTVQWTGAGIRLNALAPGAIMTPLLQQRLELRSRLGRSEPSRWRSPNLEIRHSSQTEWCSWFLIRQTSYVEA
jgi:NAD(P)-dependent dehydrogenase (short-subunit alcohol dehydrogenase family)